MQAKTPNNIAAASLSSVHTAAPHGAFRLRVAKAPSIGHALTKSQKVLVVSASRRAAEAASQFLGAGIGRSVVRQRSSRPRHFAFACSSGIITAQVALVSSPVSTNAPGKAANPLPPNRSLNRTHCGVPPLGLKNPSPSGGTPQRSG